jgi:two-component system, sensor histidine kinase
MTTTETTTEKPATTNHPGSLLQRRALVAEDNIQSQRLMQLLLSKLGFVVTVADNGQEAVDAVLLSEEQQRPFEFVFMDIDMPLMDGLTATRVLRSLSYNGKIVAVTAHNEPNDRQISLAAGCNEHVAKPVRRELLFDVIQQLAQSIPAQQS